MFIEPIDEKFQDGFAVKKLQKKVNEIIKAFNDSCTLQTPTASSETKKAQ